ncbi:hypothetical protein AWENTII_007143 [Aspergillus wentii]
MKWSFADSRVRIEEGGWARSATTRDLPTSKELAGVEMRLDEGANRELHWHQEANGQGGSFVDDLEEGDLWYFPAGYPHSLQGLSPNGSEFLLILDNGNFAEESTFLLNDWLAHTPKSVLGENFNVKAEKFANFPKSQKYIFQGDVPGAIDDEDLEVLEIFRADRFTDFSLLQWLGETPLKLVGENVYNRGEDNDDAVQEFLESVQGAEKDLIKDRE